MTTSVDRLFENEPASRTGAGEPRIRPIDPPESPNRKQPGGPATDGDVKR